MQKFLLYTYQSKTTTTSVADPGFDFGWRGLYQRGGVRKSLKVYKVKVKVILKRDLAVFLLQLCLTLIASEASEEKLRKTSVLDINKMLGPRPLGLGARRVPPAPGSASEAFDKLLLCVQYLFG